MDETQYKTGFNVLMVASWSAIVNVCTCARAANTKDPNAVLVFT